MKPPCELVNCGEPKPGFVQLAAILAKSGVKVSSYRNGDADGHDRVCDVPFTFLGQQYTHTASLIGVTESPPDPDPWSLFRYHHMQLYQAAVPKIAPQHKPIIDLVTGIYQYPGEPAVAWDHFDDGADSDQICWGVKYLQDVDVVVFRGSTTTEDWIRDFDCIAKPWCDSALGPVHPGFFLGIDHVLSELRLLLRPDVPWISAGHSLGAGRASILAGMACL